MKRFRRWLFNGIAAVSLLLCVSAVFATIHDFMFLRFSFACSPQGGAQKWVLVCVYHRTVFVEDNVISSGTQMVLPSTDGFHSWRDGTTLWVRSFFGDPRGPRVRCVARSWTIPLWPLILVAAVFPVLRIKSYPKRKETRQGHCVCCGYDLRATPDRCPECGTVAPKMETISN
jgi:hypothetical protein